MTSILIADLLKDYRSDEVDGTDKRDSRWFWKTSLSAEYWRRELASAEHPRCPGAVLKSATRISLTATPRGRVVYSTFGETQVQRGEVTSCNQAREWQSLHVLLAPSDFKGHVLCRDCHLMAPFLTLPGTHGTPFMWSQMCLEKQTTFWLSNNFSWRPSWFQPAASVWATASSGRVNQGQEVCGWGLWTHQSHSVVRPISGWRQRNAAPCCCGGGFQDISTSDSSNHSTNTFHNGKVCLFKHALKQSHI